MKLIINVDINEEEKNILLLKKIFIFDIPIRRKMLGVSLAIFFNSPAFRKDIRVLPAIS